MNPWALIGLAESCKQELALLRREETIWPECKEIKLQIIKKMVEYDTYRDVCITALLAEFQSDYQAYQCALAAA